MKNFAFTGVAGYIAPRHLQAIKDTQNTLIAAVDPHDSVGILDRYFPQTSYFTEFERFERYLEMLRRGSAERRVDYLTICSPNYLHDSHIRLALRIDADTICEKPLVINPWNLDALEKLEEETGKKINTVLQLRLHPSIIQLKKNISNYSRKVDVVLTYITSRGIWYDYSWKGIEEKSGGIATNIGIHFFDMLIWLFGRVQSSEVHLYQKKRSAGFMELENAYVRWFLSIDTSDLPYKKLSNNSLTYRSITVNGEEVQFNEGFSDLHTEVYKQIFKGNGYGIEDSRPSIELVYRIRKSIISNTSDNFHYLTCKYLKKPSHILKLHPMTRNDYLQNKNSKYIQNLRPGK